MRRITTAATGLLFTAALSLGVTGTAHGQVADRDCPDFSSQAEAQAAFDAIPGDPERLDADEDGQACEEQDYGTTSGAAPEAAGTPQVANRPSGAVAAGDGSASDTSSALPYVLGGVALTAAGGAAFAARRSGRTSV